MKRIFLTILLVAASWTLNAQWSFTYMCGLSNTQRQGGYATKSACEAAALAMDGTPCDNGSGGAWGRKVNVTHYGDGTACDGKDLPMPSNNGQKHPGDISIMGEGRGEPFIAINPGGTTEEWITQYGQWMESMGFGYENIFPITGDKAFDKAYNKAYDDQPQRYIDPNGKVRTFDPVPSPDQVSSDKYSEENLRKQMEDAKRELAECKNDFCRIMAEKKYNDAFNTLVSMSQNKAEQTLSDLMRKEYEKELEASNNKPEEKYDWGNVLIDYGELALSVAASSSKYLQGAAGVLATANISLWAEIARAINNPDEYIDWTGKHTRTYLGIEIDWYGPCKILTNSLTAFTTSIVGGKVASKVANAMPISGKQINGIYISKRSEEVTKFVDKFDNTSNIIEAVQIGLKATDIPPNNKK
jgi:hypothetical protein